MTTLVNSFEGGTTGTTVSTSNAGGSTGYGAGPEYVNNQLDIVTLSGAGAAAFDNTHSAHGGLSLKVSTSSGNAASVSWSTSLGTQTQIWFRCYLYLPAYSTGSNFRYFTYTSGASTACFFTISAAGKLYVQGNSGDVVIISANSVPLNQWFRVEGFINNTAGVVTISLYEQMDSLTATETQTSGVDALTSGNEVTFGAVSGIAVSELYWIDDIAVSTTGPLGPVVFPVTGLFPVSPPGFLSPAAFPFPNGPFGLPNDAPPTTPQPYLISNASIGGVSSNTLAIPVQYPTSRGDAIAVLLEYGSGLGNTVSCIDTQGNSYSLAVAQHNQNPWNAIYVAQNSNPLTVADTITVTFSGSTSQSRITIVVGCPTGAVTSSPGSSWLTCTSSASNTAGASSVAVATSAAVSGPMIIIGLAASPAASPIPRFPQNWNTLAVNSTDGQLVAAFLSATSVPAGSTVFQALSASSTSMSAQYVTLQLETRFASQPGLMPGSQASPPGLMSPGAWPVLPQLPSAVNDAPPVTPVPYLLAQTSNGNNITVLTANVNVTSGVRDAIVVCVSQGAGSALPLSCTDTQGNTYSTYGSNVGNADTWIFVAQNTISLSPANNDSITVTCSTGHGAILIATGVPAGIVVKAGESWLTNDLFNKLGTATGSSLSAPALPATGAPGVPEVVIAFGNNTPATAGAPVFGQDFIVVGSTTWIAGTGGTPSFGAVAYKIASGGIAPNSVVVWTQQNPGTGANIQYITLRLETRIAPNRPSPDMPPGRMSPGAWQYQPMQRSFNTLNNVMLPGNTGLVNIAAPLGTSQLNVQSVAAHNTIAAIDGSLTELITGNVSVVVQMADQGIVVLSASGSIADVTVDAENGTLHLPLVFTAPPASVDISALAGGFPVYLRGIPVTVTESALSGYLEILAIPGVAYWSGQLIIPDYDQRLI